MKNRNNNELQMAIKIVEAPLADDFDLLPNFVVCAIFNHLRGDPADEFSNWPFKQYTEALEVIKKFTDDNLELIQYRDAFTSEFVDSEGNSCLYSYAVVEYNGNLFELKAAIDSWNQIWIEDEPHVTIKPVEQKIKTITVYE